MSAKSRTKKLLEEMERKQAQAKAQAQGGASGTNGTGGGAATGAKPKVKVGDKDKDNKTKEAEKPGVSPKDTASTTSGASEEIERLTQVVAAQQLEVDGVVKRVGVCEDSILKLEKDQADKALLLRGLPMTTNYERPDKTFDMVVSRLSKILQLPVADEFSMVSAVRVGKGGGKRKGRFAHPAIKVVFYRPMDKFALLSRMKDINDHPEGKDLSFDKDMPNSKKEEEMAARQIAYQFRMENQGYKADPKLVGSKYVVQYRKKTEKSWSNLTWEEMKALRERYDKAEEARARERRAGNNGATATGEASTSASASATASEFVGEF